MLCFPLAVRFQLDIYRERRVASAPVGKTQIVSRQVLQRRTRSEILLDLGAKPTMGCLNPIGVRTHGPSLSKYIEKSSH